MRPGTVSLRNTIVAGNRDTYYVSSRGDFVLSVSTPDVWGDFVSEGHNLIGLKDGSVGFVMGTNGDIVGTRAFPIDPVLGVLTNYGGSTPTHALRPGSPAVDAGDDSIVGVDQRGQPRLVGSHVDIGAFERNPSQSAIVSFAVHTSEFVESVAEAIITVQRTNGSAAANVQFSTIGGTAIAGIDYTPVSGTLEFAPGQTEKIVHVPLLNDTTIDGKKTIEVTLSSPDSTAVIYPTGRHTITTLDEDAGVFTFTTTSSTVVEGAGSVQLTIVRSGGLIGTVLVDVDPSPHYGAPNSAGEVGDFSNARQTITFEPGVTEKTVAIPIIDDTSIEGEETFVVDLYPTGGAIEGVPSRHIVTIQDDDKPAVLKFAAAASTIAEAGSALIKVIRADGMNGTVSVSYNTAPISASAPADYLPVTGKLTFATGVTEQTIAVPIISDEDFEGDESFRVTLFSPSGSGAILGSPSTHTVTIESDDAGLGVLAFASGGTTVSEGDGNAVITVVRNNGSVDTVSVSYAAISSGSATAGGDFTVVSGTLTFGPGVTQQTITIPIVDDAVYEGSESFVVQLTNPTNGALLGSIATHLVTISENDAPSAPGLNFAGATSSVLESAGSLLITVVRSQNLENAVSVSYETSAGTATANADFIPTTGTLTFPAQVTEQTIAVPIVNDVEGESLETFTVNLSNPTNGATLGFQTTHTVTITDNDGSATIEFAAASSSVSESAGQVVVMLRRSGNTTNSVTVHVSAQADSNADFAGDGTDYTFQAFTLAFQSGQTEQTVTVPIIDDVVYEGNEQFQLVLNMVTFGNLGSQSTHTITILDTENKPAFRKASYHGLAVSSDPAPAQYAGVNIQTTPSGQLTGTIQIRGKTTRFQGRFSEMGIFEKDLRLGPGDAGRGSLDLQFESAGETMSGRLFLLETHFDVELKRDVVATKANPVAEANAYTALLQPELPGNAAGFLRTRVLPTGKITFSGMLPDRTRLSGSSHLAEDRSFPILFPLYAKLGCLAGTARIVTADPVPLTGDLHWQKPANSRPPYAGGFTDEPVELSGNVYTPPSRGQRALDDFDATQGIAFFESNTAAAPTPVSINAMWNENNTIRIIPPEFRRPANPIRITLQPKTGLFTGTFRDAENHPSKFFGICIQQAEAGADLAVGFVPQGDASGRIELVPQPPQQ